MYKKQIEVNESSITDTKILSAAESRLLDFFKKIKSAEIIIDPYKYYKYVIKNTPREFALQYKESLDYHVRIVNDVWNLSLNLDSKDRNFKGGRASIIYDNENHLKIIIYKSSESIQFGSDNKLALEILKEQIEFLGIDKIFPSIEIDLI